MSLRQTHTLIAPLYDAFLDAATLGARRRSLARLADEPPPDVLLISARCVATRHDVAYEEVQAGAPCLTLGGNEPAFGNGGFRLIRLKKTA